MKIGEAASATGVSAKMIRYYESIDLIKATSRTDAGYRTYSENELHTLRFIKRARNLGFPLEQIRDLLSLWHNANRASADVKMIALEHVADLDKRILEMIEMRDTLKHVVKACAGNHKPECPIIVSLAMPANGTIHKNSSDH